MRFRKLSNKKVQLGQTIPIKTSNGHIVAHLKVNMIYTIEPDNLYKIVHLKDKFTRQLSVRYGVKKHKISYNYIRDMKIDEKTFTMVLNSIRLNDQRLERNILIDKIINP